MLDLCRKRTELEDDNFLDDTIFGFPFVGEMPHLDYYVVPNTKKQETFSVQAMWAKRHENHLEVIESLNVSEYEDEMMKITLEEASEGWNTPPVMVDEKDLDEFMFAPRLIVREYRPYLDDGAGGYRSRIVDDETRGLSNLCTWSNQRTQNDGLDYFYYVLVTFFTRLIECVMFKGDVKSAFKKIR